MSEVSQRVLEQAGNEETSAGGGVVGQRDHCARYARGWCDGTRHRVVCGCGAAGDATCAATSLKEHTLPRCCTETQATHGQDEPF